MGCNPSHRPVTLIQVGVSLLIIKLDLSDADAGAYADLIKINRANPQRAGALKRWRGTGA